MPSSSELYEMSSTLGSFCLPDCKIWVYGFDATLRERLFKIIDFCGAISADGASASTTHLVLNDTVDEKDVSILKKCDFTNCHIVTFRWLVNSFKASARLAEPAFAHPLSQKLKSASIKAQSERTNEFVSQPAANASSPKEAIESILSQYAAQDEPSAVQPGSTGYVNDATSSTMQVSKNVTLSTQSAYENVFNGETFRLLGFNSATLEKLCKDIQRLGGIITPKNPKYLVTPLLTRLPAASDNEVELVSPIWIKNCLANNSIAPLDGSPLFRSYYLPESEKPLAGCVLCFSQFHSTERIALSQMAIGAGAKVQDVLSRFSKDNILATTHLILHSPQGDKYRSAVRWNVPCLNTSWLVDCIRCRKRVDHAAYAFSSEGGQDVPTQAGVNATTSQLKITKMATPSRPLEKRSIAEISYDVASTSYRDLDRTYQPKWKFGSIPPLPEELEPKKKVITSELASALMSAFERVNAQSAFEEANCNSSNEMSRNIPSSAFKNPLCKRVAGLNESARQTCSPVRALQSPSDAAVVPLSMEAFPGADQNVPEGVVTTLYPYLPVFSEQTANVAPTSDPAYAEDEAPRYPVLSWEDVEMRESLKQRLCTVLQMRSSSEKELLPAVNKAENGPSTSDVQRKELDHFEATSDQPPIFNSEYEDVVEAPVDWDDDNQRRAREQIGSLLKEHDQATQSSTSTLDKETAVAPRPVFLFTLISEEQRRNFQSVLSRLNVKYALTSSYEPTCTHLIAGSLGRTSKVLSAIAKGCWVLHPSFIEACDTANCLVAEEEHEWSLVESKEDDIGARLLAAAVRRWRIRVQAESTVAFQGWNILLLTQKKQKGIVEMLRNGGATVFFDLKDARKDYLAAIDVSSKCCSKVQYTTFPLTNQWRTLVDAGVRCFKLEYIVGFLLDNPFEEKAYQLFETDFSDEETLS
ncbi:BRCT and PTCB-BRCT domain containing protein [Trichuris trichiura]|uniref:BRCT and PTCB-BRCT domain containing protein n=1 Tax=Trichuris trichiura TaxID=36087 RepID=A0A077ZHE6_TRITR|nr:BRCT and PTCB-BRCT domain containing protein [Trichuris trichiura]